MGLNAKTVKNNAGTRVAQPVLDAAGYPGRLVQVIDYGLQTQRPFQGQEKPPVNEIGLGYELVDEFMIDKDGKVLEDKPRWYSEAIPFHNLDQDKAKSTQRYKALDPTVAHEGEWPKLLGAACIVNLVVETKKDGSGTKYNKIASLGTIRAKDAEKLPALQNPPVCFLLDEPDLEVFKSFPDWVQDKIKGNLNYNGSKLQKLLGETPKAKAAEAPAEEEVVEVESESDGLDTPDEANW